MSNSKMPRTSGDHRVPWSIDDHDRCVELVLRARQRGAFDLVMNRVRRVEEGLQADLAAVGLTDGDYAKCDEICAKGISGHGAMTDASKRSHAAVDLDENDDDVETQGYVMPQPSSPPMSHDQYEVPVKVTFPPGVQSLQEWGSFKVTFGKFKGKKSYYQVYLGRTLMR